MKIKNLITIALLFFFTLSFSQKKDTIYGKVKKIREKVEFLTKKENPQFMYYDDYGHSGFRGSEATIHRFNNIWYSTNSCYYLNYEKHFDEKGRLLEDNWFTKKDSFMESYKYKYDKKDRLIRKIDSSEYSFGTETHFYNGENHETEIYEDVEFEIFTHNYRRYKAEKVILSKSINEYGTIDEYLFKYNSDGKLLYRIYKNPNSWKKSGERSWTYGPQDSLGNVYKDLVNEYDKSNNLIKTQRFDLYEDDNHSEPKLVETTINEYEENNLILTKHINGYIVVETFNHYVYDNAGRLIEKYCCSEKKSDAKRIEKYGFNENKIISLEFTEELFATKEIKTYKIEFKYKYDDKGNWKEITKTVDGTDLFKWIREIDYYE